MSTFLRIVASFFLLFSVSFSVNAQTDYFIQNKKVNPAIPTPDAYLGYPFGSWHTRYDKMVAYLKELDRLSDRVSVETMGYTNENREQVLVTFTKPENMARIEEVRKEHLKLTNPSQKAPEIKAMPVVVWLGHNVHGNEPSGGESSLLSAYYIAAVEDEEVTKWLDNAVILMEPVINPDGRDRHTHWANMHRGTPPVADSQDREHNEAWPGGRTNHYWFDLNRDWYLATQVESQNRLKAYHKWLPNVVTDFHEMGTNATFFFEPTKENAENPLVPKAVYRDLNSFFAKYFEKALNDIGSLYYTKESYDNLYPGYGSSYPDIQGGLGLLFEQASSRGHVQESQNGDLEFKFTIRNQFVNALATIRASVDGREMLLKHQRDFFEEVTKQGKKSGVDSYVVGDAADHSRNQEFWKLLLHHNIEFYHVESDVKLNNESFTKGNAVVIPCNQPQYLMLRSIFDKPKTFADSLFYDASAWNLALAYNLPYVETNSKVTQGQRITIQDTEIKQQTVEKSSYAYLINYSDYFAPKALYHLLKNEVFVKVSSKEFSTKSNEYSYGSLVIPVALQRKMDRDKLHELIQKIQLETGVKVESVSTGFSTSGIDLGSNGIDAVQLPKAAILVGDGTSGYEAGEIWHLLDTRVGMPISKLETTRMSRINLSEYNTLVMVDGNYDKDLTKKVKDFVTDGGTLITFKSATEWAIKNKLVDEKLREEKTDSSRTKPRMSYEYANNVAGAKRTGGAIFKTTLDLSHPIGYGFTRNTLPVYRNDNTVVEPTIGAANSPLMYTGNPWICGYVHPESLARISSSAAVNVASVGQGRVILFAQNPNFRATWYGTNKLFLNALLFGGML
ncbi:MAG: hypothetical protein ACJA1O_002994 [Spirosomataceae bacterium]|jgi:hypothetical protein